MDDENGNQMEGIIDLDDIEEISLMEMNRKNINQSDSQEKILQNYQMKIHLLLMLV